MIEKECSHTDYKGRRRLVLGAMAACLGVLVWRLVDLHVLDRDFYRDQGDARILREIAVPAHRGMLTDRNGVPLAISTPVASVWANPAEVIREREHWPDLVRVLDLDVDGLERKLGDMAGRKFTYLQRQVTPERAARVKELGVPGVYLQKEYRRYYPAGEVAAHIVGFTDVDDQGQEGLELAYDHWLTGVPGSKRVLLDGRRRVFKDVDSLREPRAGRDLALSIDLRLQYLAYRELKAAIVEYQARSGSLVLLDVNTGEVLAMVNQPAFNPNKRSGRTGSRFRNRAVTDPFEPGSTVKPFTIASALENGAWTPETPVDTRPGTMQVGRNLVRDVHDYGLIDVATVIKKSSNVGAAKIALALPKAQLWGLFARVGFGEATGSGFPGETPGILSGFSGWRPIEQATFAFGYGLSATALQLARAYAVFGAGGIKYPSSFLRLEQAPEGERVLEAEVVSKVVPMLESVVESGGTATGAAVSGYRIAGKTGTVKKVGAEGYSKGRYIALFAGIAPASRPRLAMVVMVNEPQGRKYYGGQVAAPVFAQVMAGALRLLNIPPDGEAAPAAGVRLAATRTAEP